LLFVCDHFVTKPTRERVEWNLKVRRFQPKLGQPEWVQAACAQTRMDLCSYRLAASLPPFGNLFFPPASGKIHIARIMKAAVASTKFPNSGRTGEPLQRAKMIATMATAAET
jgi:hypothetical protein